CSKHRPSDAAPESGATTVPPPMMTETTTDQRPEQAPPRWTAYLFPVVLWFLSCFFHLGRIGKWGDHYSWPHRTYVTGEIEPPDRKWFNERLWGPVGVVTSKLQVTYLWNWDWAVHLVGALAHAWSVVVLYWFLCRVCRWRPLACAGALVFMTYGPGFEVV